MTIIPSADPITDTSLPARRTLTGAGLNNFPIVDNLYSLAASHEVHAHNVFLQTTVDQGVLGLVAFIALFASALTAGWRAYRSSGDANLRVVVLGCAGACLAYLGFGLWDAITLGDKPAPAMWVIRVHTR